MHRVHVEDGYLYGWKILSSSLRCSFLQHCNNSASKASSISSAVQRILKQQMQKAAVETPHCSKPATTPVPRTAGKASQHW
jgi:hypothetical protein